MLKPLSQEKIDRIISTATKHFADRGFVGANINTIAKEAGVSVGVLYKYYGDKEGLCVECIRNCLLYLDEIYEETQSAGGSLRDMAESIITKAQRASREHPDYMMLYHQLTVSGAYYDVKNTAELIEGRAATVYTKFIEQAKEEGVIRDDIDPALFALFFDNLLMMVHFSYASEYYKERFKLYGGENILDEEYDERVRQQLLKFIGGAMMYKGEE